MGDGGVDDDRNSCVGVFQVSFFLTVLLLCATLL